MRATLDVWAGEKAALAADVPLDRHQPLIDMAGAEAVKRILEIGAPRTEIEERELVCRDLFAARYLLVVDVADAVLPHLDTPGRRDLVEAFETATAAEAFDSFRRRQGLREETLRSLRDVHAEGTKDGRLDSTAR